MDEDDIYKTPEADLENQKKDKSVRISFGKKFIITFLWAVPTFMFFVMVYTPKERWLAGLIGSVVLSLLSGIIGMFIPSKNKIVIVSLGVFLGLFAAYIIGISTRA